MTNPPHSMQIHIGRDNQQLGTFTVQQVLGGLASGQFLPTDIAWHEGLADWQPLSALAILSAEHPAATPPAAPPLPVRPQPVFERMRPGQGTAQPARTSALAGWSLGLGISSLFLWVLTGVPAIICGHMALSRIKKSAGTLGGRGLAISGIITSYLMIFVGFAIMAAVAVPTFNVIQQKAAQAKSANNVRMLLLACRQYASDHNGHYPPDLESLEKEGLIEDPRVFHCPVLNDDSQIGYRYYGGGLTENHPPDKVVIISIAASRGGKRVVGHNDGSVEIISVPMLPQPR